MDADVDETLVTRLRSWRLERSQADAVPAYVVLHDATLRELAALRPQTMDELAGVKGFGPVKLERYGDDLLVGARCDAVAPCPANRRRGLG